jgi:hypothetical protein
MRGTTFKVPGAYERGGGDGRGHRRAGAAVGAAGVDALERRRWNSPWDLEL